MFITVSPISLFTLLRLDLTWLEKEISKESKGRKLAFMNNMYVMRICAYVFSVCIFLTSQFFMLWSNIFFEYQE